jgi:hypothetical protein
MSEITYSAAADTNGQMVYWVRLSGRTVGFIRKDERGYFYRPKDSQASGERFQTLAECKRSLEAA